MNEWHCEICGRTAPYTARRRLLCSAIRDITGAENICKSCLERIQTTDWNAVIRRELTREVTA